MERVSLRETMLLGVRQPCHFGFGHGLIEQDTHSRGWTESRKWFPFDISVFLLLCSLESF